MGHGDRPDAEVGELKEVEAEKVAAFATSRATVDYHAATAGMVPGPAGVGEDTAMIGVPLITNSAHESHCAAALVRLHGTGSNYALYLPGKGRRRIRPGHDEIDATGKPRDSQFPERTRD